MDQALLHLEKLTTEEWNTKSNYDNKDVDYSSNLKYSRTDDTPASNFGKSSMEEVQYYLEMQQQLEGDATVELDAGKQCVEEGVQPELPDSDDKLTDVAEYPWTSINPILRLRGPVATGYGRGGKKLGVPTANVSQHYYDHPLEREPACI